MIRCPGHGNAEARVGASLDFFRKTGALVAHEEGHGLAPIDFPRSQQRLITATRFADTRSKRANTRDVELRKKNRKRNPSEDRKMQSGASGGAQSFRRERVGSAADAGSHRGGAGHAERGSSA